MKTPIRVLVLGGGFAGRNAALTLARKHDRYLSVRLIDRKAESEFAPLFADVVSGRIRPGGVRHSLSAFCKSLGIEFMQANVEAIDLAARRVTSSGGTMDADFLILALGCESNFHGNQQMHQRAFGLKSIAEALAMRHATEAHIRTLYDRDEPFHLLVVGGGYTGIETASHLAYLMRRQTHLSWERLQRIAVVQVVDRADQILPMIPPKVAQWAIRHIAEYDIRIRTGVSAQEFVDPYTVRLTDGSTIENAMVVWTAGVTPGPACAVLDVQKMVHGRLAVDEHLRLPGYERVFVAGDLAGAVPPGRDQPLRMSVQFSRMAGRTAARNVLLSAAGRPLKIFDPFDLGYVVPLAHGLGVGNIFGWECHGRLPYNAHYLMSLYRSWTWPNRRAVLKDLLDLPPAQGHRAECAAPA